MTDALTARLFAKDCPACDGTLSGSADMLCPECWRRVPRPLVTLYRLAWRLTQAGLADTDGIKAFAELLVDDVRARRAGRTTVRAETAPDAPARSTATNGRGTRGKRGESTRLRLAHLPTTEAEAISARDLAARTKEPQHIVDVWCSHGRRTGLIPGLRWVEVGPRRFAYWRSV